MEQSAASQLSAALSGSGIAQSIKASQLTAQWRSFSPNADQANLYAALSHQRALVSPPFYTRGDTIRAGSETYLIAYRQKSEVPTDARMRRQMMADDDGDGVPNSREAGAPDQKLRPDAVLTLSLLNLRTLGNLDDVRGFDPAKEVLSAAEAKKLASEQDTVGSMNNLRQIGLGMMQYMQDYDAQFPPMRSAQSQAEITAPTPGKPITVQQALQPYVRSTKIFSHPRTRELYVPNIAVSGVSESSLESSAQTVAFWEKSPAPDGRRAVLYLDGHVKRELETEWPQIMARSNRLLPPKRWKPVSKPKRRAYQYGKTSYRTTMIEGMRVEHIRAGTGKSAKAGNRLAMHYRGFLQDGTLFDESYKRGEPFTFTLGAGEVISGWDKGIVGMKQGGKRRLTIPARLAYGPNGQGTIPANATLIFEVELRKLG
jgi:prepilin-type processing-associated H-X9-DG protein